MKPRYGLFLSLIIMAGCATTTPKQVTALENRLQRVEAEVNKLNSEIETLKVAAARTPDSQPAKTVDIRPAQKPTLKAEPLHVTGMSYGGVLRAAPSIDSPKISSLPQGQKFTLLERAAKVSNGYRWFKVVLPSGQIGYQWGGILCSFTEESVGAFRLCSGGE